LVFFDTDVELAERLLAIVYRELEKIAAEGPTQEHFDNVLAFLSRNIAERRRDNTAWMSSINEYAFWQTETFTQQEAIVNSITPADIQALVRTILAQRNIAEIVMTGVPAQ